MIRMDWLKVLEHRVAQRTDRANTVLYILAVAPLMGAMWLLQWAPVLHPAAVGAYRPELWPWLQGVHGGLLVWMLGWLLYLWPRRRDEQPDPVAVQCVLVPSMIGLLVLVLGMGVKDTPMGMFLLVAFIVGRGLFSMAQMRWGLLACLFIVVFHEFAQVIDVLPYAFLLERPIYVGEPLTAWWSFWLRVIALLALAPLSGVLFVLAWLLQRQNRALKALVLSDALTGLANRRAFMTQLGREAHRHERHGRPLSLIIMDIDHFKQINDQWGHAMGDEVLRHLGLLLRQHTREDVDLAARYGGEEFVVLLPETDLAGARAVAEKLAVRFREQDFVAKGRHFRVTMSLGVVQYAGGDPDLALREADRNLYQAKAQGRDRIVATVAHEAVNSGPTLVRMAD